MEERFLRTYIGDNSTKIINTNINIFAGLLGMTVGPVWFFYRKSWLPGVLYIVLAYLLNKFFKIPIETIAIILGGVTIFVANRIYIWDAKRKINKIKISNRGIKENDLLEILEQKGGTSISAAIIYVVALFVLLIYIVGSFISEYSYVFDRIKKLIELTK